MSEPRGDAPPPNEPAAGEEYLWDPTSPADPFLEKLEADLQGLRTSAPLKALPPRGRRTSGGRLLRFAALGAGLAAAASVAWLLLRSPDAVPIAVEADVTSSAPSATMWAPPRFEAPAGPSFAWRALSGQADIDGAPAGTQGRLATGRLLETGPDARVRLDVADIGYVEVGASSRLKLLGTGPGDTQRGGLDAAHHRSVRGLPGSARSAHGPRARAHLRGGRRSAAAVRDRDEGRDGHRSRLRLRSRGRRRRERQARRHERRGGARRRSRANAPRRRPARGRVRDRRDARPRDPGLVPARPRGEGAGRALRRRPVQRGRARRRPRRCSHAARRC